MPEMFDHYYDSRQFFSDYFKRHSRQSGLPEGIADRRGLAAWQRRARRMLTRLIGLDRMEGCPPKARKLGSTDCGDHFRERWLMDTQPLVQMPFYILRPTGSAGRRLPAVICPNGHLGGGASSVAGYAVSPAVEKAMADFNYAYGVDFVRAGFLAVCPEARGMGQRSEKEIRHDILQESCHHLQLMGLPLGFTVAGMWTFDLMRLVDHLVGWSDVDATAVGCAGFSGGGGQTLLLAALDKRIRAAIVSGYFFGQRESFLEHPFHCDCIAVPHMWEHFDLGDIGAMIARRPLLVQSGNSDPLNGASGLRNVQSQIKIVRRAWRTAGAPERFEHHIHAGGHQWYSQGAAEWMRRWLCPKDPMKSLPGRA